ncbi:MAG: hypothetical protein AAFQ57_05015 [Cyanobacteria bacterium J06626_14]
MAGLIAAQGKRGAEELKFGCASCAEAIAKVRSPTLCCLGIFGGDYRFLECSVINAT